MQSHLQAHRPGLFQRSLVSLRRSVNSIIAKMIIIHDPTSREARCKGSETIRHHLPANPESVFHATPGVKHSPVCLGHRKVVPPATRLIVCAADGNLGVVTEEERADGAVPNKKHIAFMVAAENRLRFVHDANLGIDRALPAADALIRIRKECIGHTFKLDWRQKSRRRTIVLVHLLANFERDTQGLSQWFSGLHRLLLGAGDNQCGSPEPAGRDKSLDARATDSAQAPPLHRNMWINLDLRMCQVAHECCHWPSIPEKPPASRLPEFLALAGWGTASD